ncbi:MAG: class I SAM-dependent methyltransferase [Verrucomicrobiales bacterium]|nr:class I SAM-dependent methyltransferase [Verrucomicrobiales bacterium]
MARPRVTCVMVTGHQAARRPLALRAIESFRRQLYGNRELLIVNQGLPFDLPDGNIRELPVNTGQRTLGDLRNIGLLASDGDLVTAWDDDDYHGSRRLTEQVEHGWPCMLQNMVLVNSLTSNARVISAKWWRQGGFPGTLLFPRHTRQRYASLPRGEDNDFAARFMCNRPLVNSPLDYIRFHHGDNTCPDWHYANLLTCSHDLTEDEQRSVTALQWWIEHTPRRCTTVADVKQVIGSLPWMNWRTARFLDTLIRQHGLREVLEIGHMHGVSTCYLAVTGAQVTTVDVEPSRCNVPTVEDTLRACGLTATIVRRPSRIALADWAISGLRWDLIYVDGSHALADVWCDVLLADQVLQPGGWLIVDDIANDAYPGVKQVWDRLPEHYERRSGPHADCGVAQKRH